MEDRKGFYFTIMKLKKVSSREYINSNVGQNRQKIKRSKIYLTHHGCHNLQLKYDTSDEQRSYNFLY
jgi:hypothetical protein